MDKMTALAAERERILAKQAAQAEPKTLQQRIKDQVRDLVQAFAPAPAEAKRTGGYARATVVLGRHVYGGTANPNAVAKRRARNRMARRTRQSQRRG